MNKKWEKQRPYINNSDIKRDLLMCFNVQVVKLPPLKVNKQYLIIKSIIIKSI